MSDKLNVGTTNNQFLLSRESNKKFLSKFSSILGLLALFIFSSILSPDSFLSVNNFGNILRQVSVLGFASLGMTIVILTGNIDLSIIGNVSMTTVITAVLLQRGFDIWLVFLIVVLAGAVVGMINGTILSYWKIEAFVVTMGMQVVCYGMAMFIADGRTVIVNNLSPFMIDLASAKIGFIPIMFIVLLISSVLLWVFTKKTKMGRYLYALGGNEEVCYISGVNVFAVRVVAYVLSGFTAAIAGIFTFSRSLCGDPTAGTALGMYVVAAVVIGGTKMSGGRGNVLLTIVGIFIIGMINNILNLTGFQYYAQQIIQGIIIIVAVVISSQKRR